MTDNRTLIQKADTALSTLAPGGILTADQYDKFVRLAIDKAVMMGNMTRVDMRAPSELREKIRFGSRALRKGLEATALPVAQRSAPDTSKIELNAQLVKAEARVSYEALEDSIERGNFESTVRDTLAERISLDLEDLAFNGDTTSSDDLLVIMDGFIKQATTNGVPAGSASISRNLLRDMIKTMPSEFRRDKRSMQYLTADEVVLDYHELIAARETVMGDTHIDGPATRGFNGIPVTGVPVFPVDLGAGTDESVVMLLDPGNMLFGVWRELRIEADRDISAGVWLLVVTARVVFKFAHEPAVVKATAVTAV